MVDPSPPTPLGTLDLPGHAINQLAVYQRVTGRDPRIVEATFLEGVNADPVLPIEQRVAGGWARLKELFPTDHKRWVKHKLEDERPPPPPPRPNPWLDRTGWVDEPTLPILTKELRKQGQPTREVPVEDGYELYNRLISEFCYRPFRTDGGDVRVAIPSSHGLEIGNPESPDFPRLVGYSVFTVEGEPIPNRELTVAVAALSGRARSRALPSERIVRLWLRVAPNGPFSSRVDLMDAERRCVVIAPEGWRIEQTGHPVFDPRRHMRALPTPTGPPDSSRVNGLWRYVCLSEQPQAPGDDQRLLALTMLVQFLVSPGTPKTVVIIDGEEGIGKSSSALRLQEVIDPSLTPLVKPPDPNKPDELNNLVANHAVINLDNISRIDAELSDDLARLSTGISQPKRTLYSDRDETVITALPQVIVNGIGSSPSAPDLLRRCVFLCVVRPAQAMPREQLDSLWAVDASGIFSGLLDLACEVLAILRDRPPELDSSSMADFVRIGQAVAIACGKPASAFVAAWKVNAQRIDEAASQNPWILVLQEYFGALNFTNEARADLIAEWVNEHKKHCFPKPVTATQVGLAILRSKATLGRMKIYVGKRMLGGVSVYYRREAPEVRQEPDHKSHQVSLDGSPPPPPPRGGFSDGEGEVGVPQNGGGRAPNVHLPGGGRAPNVHLTSTSTSTSPSSSVREAGGGRGGPFPPQSDEGGQGPASAGPPLQHPLSPLTEETFETGPETSGSGRAASARRRLGKSPGAGTDGP